MSEELDYTPELYTLEDEDGKEQTFEMLDAMEYEGERYYALVPYQESPEELIEDDGELVILKSRTEGDEEFLDSIDDDEEFDKIGALFLKRIEDMFDEDEDEEGCGCGDGCNCGDGCGCGCDHE